VTEPGLNEEEKISLPQFTETSSPLYSTQQSVVVSFSSADQYIFQVV
jgi:hypothetical protein